MSDMEDIIDGLATDDLRKIWSDPQAPAPRFVEAAFTYAMHPDTPPWSRSNGLTELGKDPRITEVEGAVQRFFALASTLSDEERPWCTSCPGLVRWSIRSLPLSELSPLERYLRGEGERAQSFAPDLALRAGALKRRHGEEADHAVLRLLSIAEEMALTRERPTLSTVVDTLSNASPAVSDRLLEHVLGRLNDLDMRTTTDPFVGVTPRRRLFLFVATTPLPEPWQKRLLALRDEYYHVALASCPSVAPEIAETLWRRYADNAGIPARMFVAPAPGRAERFLNANDPEGLRGLARHLDRVEPEFRYGVAKGALRFILSSPSEEDHDAAFAIYRELGEEAGIALVKTQCDRIAHGVIKAWRHTTDGVFEELVDYPREVVRRKMVPGGAQWGEPYSFSPDEEERLRTTIVPRLLKDRAKEVRKRAQRVQDFFDWLDNHPDESAANYPYPARWDDDQEQTVEDSFEEMEPEFPWAPLRTELD